MSLLDIRTYRGVDIGSDHELVVGQIQLKLKAKEKMEVDETKKEFVAECCNRFAALLVENINTDMDKDSTRTNQRWISIKKVYQNVAECTW